MEGKSKTGRKLLGMLLMLAIMFSTFTGMVSGMTKAAHAATYDDYLAEATNHDQNFVAAGICDQSTGLLCKSLSVDTAIALERYLESKTGSKVAVIYGCTLRPEHPGWSRISFVIDGTTETSYYMDAQIASAISKRGARNHTDYKLFYVSSAAPDFETVSTTVTFKVVNGQWDDGTTDDVTVNLIGLRNTEIKLASNQIPPVGSKPNDTFKEGSWDVTPSTGTAITEATTYTYTYAQKVAAVVTTIPTAKALIYNGQAQALVTAGEATGTTMMYALGTDATTVPTSGWIASVPTGTEARTYYVWYKAVENDDYLDSEEKCITAKIAEKDDTDAEVVVDEPKYTNTEGTGSNWNVGTTGTLDFRFKRSENDETTYDHCTGVKVDGKLVAESNYTKEKGSVIIKLKSSYLETLSVGKHTITAVFDDGDDVTVGFTVAAKKAEVEATTTEAKKTESPKTGDSAPITAVIAIMSAFALLGTGYMVKKR